MDELSMVVATAEMCFLTLIQYDMLMSSATDTDRHEQNTVSHYSWNSGA